MNSNSICSVLLASLTITVDYMKEVEEEILQDVSEEPLKELHSDAPLSMDLEDIAGVELCMDSIISTIEIDKIQPWHMGAQSADCE